MSGFGVSAARLALPDAGLISYAEMLDTGRYLGKLSVKGFSASSSCHDKASFLRCAAMDAG